MSGERATRAAAGACGAAASAQPRSRVGACTIRAALRKLRKRSDVTCVKFVYKGKKDNMDKNMVTEVPVMDKTAWAQAYLAEDGVGDGARWAGCPHF